jgi:pSer/pThr/pTyr-binding forkhead associated (FHA) protein
MPEQLLAILKLCLLALLYLFFLRVLRAVWAEVTPPKVAPETPAVPPPPKSSKAKAGRTSRKGTVPTKLVLVEPAPRAGAEYPLGDDLTLGRAPGCSIVLDEQYVSQVHSRVFQRDNSVFVEDLGSTNGTWLNGVRAVAQMHARPGDRIQIGNVILEFR